MKTLTLCMIVKDGEKYIEQCINSVCSIVSEIIVVDTGSTDHTLDYIKAFRPKIYYYTWNNNFADARNYSIQQATGDYILVLDADEIVDTNDLPKLQQLLSTTNADGISIQFHNFTDEHSEENFNTHLGLRLFKNKCFHYEGAIHEQLVFNNPEKPPILEISEIKVKHYGYLKSNSGLKKHNRNMPILRAMLAQNPNDAFHLFNIGNEYMSLEDYQTALYYFEKSDKYKIVSMAYSPHMMYRRATCLHLLKRNQESLTVIAEALKLYPSCTDLEFFRGRILGKMKRFTLAIDSFQKCLAMGEAPPTLRFFAETANFRPLMEIAGIYALMDDYPRALDYYLKALKVNGKQYYVLYEVGKMLNKMYADKDLVVQNLKNLFADCRFKANVMVMTDILLDEKLYDQAEKVLNEYTSTDYTPDTDIYFLKARLLFHNKDYTAAFAMFKQSITIKEPKGILPTTSSRALGYITACSLIDTRLQKESIKFISLLDSTVESTAYLAFLNAHHDPLDKQTLTPITAVLSHILSACEYQVFEKSLSTLNQVDCDDVLLALAEVYYRNNYHDMAVKTILRSIKELDSINSSSVMILSKEFSL